MALFSALNFGPLILVSIIISIPYISVVFHSPNILRDLELPVCCITPVLIGSLLSFRLFSRTKNWSVRGWIIYGSWLIMGGYLAGLISYIGLDSTMGYEYLGRADKIKYFVRETGLTLLVAHLFIIPWVFFCFKRMKREMFSSGPV